MVERNNQKRPQGKVDKALAKLSSAQLAEWRELVKFNSNYSALIAWLNEQGFQGINPQNMSNWWISNRPRGKEARTINAIAEKYEGIDTGAAMSLSIGLTADLVTKLHESLTDPDGDRLNSVRPVEQLIAIANLAKELHTASNNLQKHRQSDDRENLIKAGAYAMAGELRKVFKGTAFSEALEEAIESVMIQIDESS